MEVQINSIDHICFLQFAVTSLKSCNLLLQYISSKRKAKGTVTPVLSGAGDLVAKAAGKNERLCCFHLRFYWCGLSSNLSDFMVESAGVKCYLQ